MDSKSEMTDALELLKWQLELGVDENVGNIPLDRFSDHSQADEVKIETPVFTPVSYTHLTLPTIYSV